MLIVTASEDDHNRIQAVLSEADKRGGTGDLVTRAYTLQTANPSTIMTALTPVVPNATISVDAANQMLVATASEEDHAQIKAIVDEADRRNEGEITTEVYPLKWANPYTLSMSIKPIAPTAVISPDMSNKTLIVSATAKDHARIKPVIEQADTRGGGELLTKAYTLRTANPNTILAALQPAVPDAKISSDVANQMLIVTASADDHKRIESIVDEADRRKDGELVTQVYRLKWANPYPLSTSIKPIAPQAIVSPDVSNRTLIVTASLQDHARVKQIVEQADRRGEGELTTKVYPFKLANPATIANALTTLMPTATLSSDNNTNTLIVTATDADHKMIEPLVAELDVADPKSAVLKPYRVESADPQHVYRALNELFRSSRNVNVGYQQETGTILVFAPPAEQDEVARAIQDIDQMTAGRPKATLEVYPLEGLDGDAAVESLRSLLVDETPKVELQVDLTNNQILAIAEPRQHAMLRSALSQLVPEQREMEVFSLQRIDPYTAQSAITTLFMDLPLAATPSVDSDPNTQQLMVRATRSQLTRIRELLDKLGEGPTRPRDGQSGAPLRILPLSGDVEGTLRQLERIWPQVSGNPLQVIAPPQRRRSTDTPRSRTMLVPQNLPLLMPQQEEPAAPRDESREESRDEPRDESRDESREEPREESRDESRDEPRDARPAEQPGEPTPETEELPEADAPEDGEEQGATGTKGAAQGKSAATRRIPALLVSVQRPAEPDAAEPDAAEPDVQEPAPPALPGPAGGGEGEPAVPAAAAAADERVPQDALEETPQDAAHDEANEASQPERPPIVVVVGEGRITVTSRDAEALDQFENLLKTLQRGRRVRIEAGNYSMFLLQNADARQLSEVINELFQRGQRGGGGDGSYRSYFRRSSRLTVVADERMNALLVYGSIADRDAIEQMLDVLDGMDIPDSLNTPRPRMIPVKNLPARTILSTLETVYKTQLTARAGVRPMTIPQGLSFEMTSMLQLLNAAAEAPLLTLDIDETTNSIVMRAPRPLGEEIEEFVEELDIQAKESGTRNISLVPLKSMNSEQLQDALRLLMPGGRMRGRGR